MSREKVRRWEYSRDKVKRREKKKKMGVENNFVIYGTMEKGKGVKGGGEGGGSRNELVKSGSHKRPPPTSGKCRSRTVDTWR